MIFGICYSRWEKKKDPSNLCPHKSDLNTNSEPMTNSYLFIQHRKKCDKTVYFCVSSFVSACHHCYWMVTWFSFWLQCLYWGKTRVINSSFPHVLLFTYILLSILLSMFICWLSTSWFPTCTLDNKTHEADNSSFSFRRVDYVSWCKGEVLNDLTSIHRMGQSGHWDRCTCWAWNRIHLHMNSGRLLQRRTRHTVKQHKKSNAR